MAVLRRFALGVAIAMCMQSRGLTASEGQFKSSVKRIEEAPENGCRLEVGALMGHHSNVLYRPNGSDPVPAATISTLYMRGCARAKLFTGYLNARVTTFSSEVDVASHEVGLAGLMFSPGRARISLEYVFMPDTVSSEGDEDFFELRGGQISVRYGRSRGVWVEVAYGMEDWFYGADDNDRNAVVRQGESTVRFPLGGPVGLRLTYLRFDKQAIDPRHNWNGDGAALSFEARPGDRVDMRLRFRRRERAYEDATSLSDNFERQDEIRDVALDFRTQVARHWGIRMQGSYSKVVSSQDGRSHDVIQASAGIFVNL